MKNRNQLIRFNEAVIEKNKITACFLFLLIILNIVSYCSAEEIRVKEADVKKTYWSINTELGAGSLISILVQRKISGKISVGLGGGFDYGIEKIGIEKYETVLINGNMTGIYHLIADRKVNMDFRLKLGYDKIIINEFSAEAYEITPELVFGKDVYVVVSECLMFSKTTVAVPGVGVGYRVRI